MNKSPVVSSSARRQIYKTNLRLETVAARVRIPLEIMRYTLSFASTTGWKILLETNLKLRTDSRFASFLWFDQWFTALKRQVQAKVMPTFERHVVGEIRGYVEDLQIRTARTFIQAIGKIL